MKYLLPIICFALAGCVSVPVPPFGNRVGELGDLKVSVQVKYIPKTTPEREPTDSMKYAWSQFALSKPKLLTDK